MPGSVADALVLIVDDDARNLKLARDVLLAAGYRTLVAETGNEAVALAAEHLPDVILMDLRLPDMDGTDAARILRGEARTAVIPVVLLSSISLEESTTWLADAGFAGYLAKPIDIDEFPCQVRRFCRRGVG
jgi:two-component system cell cycle response regulator DivK